MAGTPKTSIPDGVTCGLPMLAAAAAVALGLLNATVPAVILAAAGLAVGVAALAAGERLSLGKRAARLGFVAALSACVFVVAYAVLSYVAFLAVQSF
ncbi:hypothetical protein [Pseudoflavonifractor phocaeensis]|uniref:hypothetical protein n=1 Tax=Pseudoflavonifractor phocaeensis TaxID=1870988 RepID=UPI00210C1D5B|nr:hypothetical protein [Pseudoflavonifractor phocaeensis]MCQ4863370.1 hypothetical protein [Pseudoflavonifractor phocaeensis]